MPASRLPRDVCLVVRLTAAEADQIERRAKASGQSKSAYVRARSLASDNPAPVLVLQDEDRAAIRSAVAHLARIGGNVNQIARAANRRGGLPADLATTLDDTRKACTRAKCAILDAIEDAGETLGVAR